MGEEEGQEYMNTILFVIVIIIITWNGTYLFVGGLWAMRRMHSLYQYACGLSEFQVGIVGWDVHGSVAGNAAPSPSTPTSFTGDFKTKVSDAVSML